MSWPLGIFSFLVPILVLVILAGAVVLLLRRGEGGLDISFQTVVSAYLALVIGAALIVAAAGFARVLKAAFSDAFGRDFSYQSFVSSVPVRPSVPPGVPMPAPEEQERVQREAEERERNRVENLYRDDVVYGVTMLVVGILMFGIHAAGRQFLRRRAGEPPLIHRAYLLLMLGTTSVVALASLIAATADLARRYILQSVGPEVMLPSPGGALATTIAFIPLWLWFLFRILREISTPGQSPS